MASKAQKIVLIADIHKGQDKTEEGKHQKLSSRALSLLKYLVGHCNKDIQPEFVVQLGNLIEDEDAEEDAENYDSVMDALRALTMPLHVLVGDCDQVNLDIKKQRKSLKHPQLYYSFDSGAFHFVVLFSSATNHSDIHVDQPQRKWLEADLAATDKQTILFIHHPIDDQDMSGNYWYEKNPEQCFVEERVELRDMLSRTGKVRAVFSGHVHRNNLEEHGGVHYVSLQSLVENVSDTRKVPSESFAIVTLTEDATRVEIEGMDPAEFRF
jgi:predicted phosphodiesterase